MDERTLSAVTVLVFVGVLGFAKADIVVDPQDTTAAQGDDVVLRCTVNSPGTDSITWREHITEITGTKIYVTGGEVSDSSKYEIVADSREDLMVMNLGERDGGKYTCEHIDDSSGRPAQLVILQIPSIFKPTVFEEGTPANFTCRAIYSADLLTYLQDSHHPNIKVYLGGQEMTKVTVVIDEKGAGQTSSVEAFVEYDPLGADNEKELRCVAQTQDPYFELEETDVVEVYFPVREMDISPRNPTYYVDESINCTAKGNPWPSFVWRNLMQTEVVQQGQILPITQSMMGENEWRCEATQIEYPEAFESQDISFYVEEGIDPEETSGGGGGTEDWVIAVSVCLSLLVVAAIVVVVIIWYRKRQQKKEEPKTPYSSYPDPEEMNKTNYTGGEVNPLPNPSFPADTVPTGYPGHSGPPTPTNVGKDSPGYGDLGIKHVNPNPNVSWDDNGYESKPDTTYAKPGYSNQVYEPDRGSLEQNHTSTPYEVNLADYGNPAMGGTSV